MAAKKKPGRAAKRLNKTPKRNIVKQDISKLDINDIELVKNTKRTWGWQPGKSGNPLGRPKKDDTYIETLREIMKSNKLSIEMTLNGKKQSINFQSKQPIHTVIASRQALAALNGDHNAQKEINDRLYGKAAQTIRGSIQVNHVVLDSAAQMIASVLLEKIKDPVLLKEISDSIRDKMASITDEDLDEIAKQGDSF